jgi:nitroreductase
MGAWKTFAPLAVDTFLVALTSITWREAWKYGERAYRYCQHDAGHAIGALRVAAALLGWRLRLLNRWSDGDLVRLLGLDRSDDFLDAEREEPVCLAVVTAGDVEPWLERDPEPLVSAAAGASWHGTANLLSRSHVEWPAINEVAAAARYQGGSLETPTPLGVARLDIEEARADVPVELARRIILMRRSAVAFDAVSRLSLTALLSMLSRVQPNGPPWDAMGWPPQVHLALFVHRVDGLVPGIYAYMRDDIAGDEWKKSMRPEFLWEPKAPSLFLLAPVDVREAAMQVSCNQEIAGDGFLSLGMLARFDASLTDRGDWFYRRLFWECGLIGQVLYLAAEAAGVRSTGIGCFFDDPVHEMLGLSGHAWQSLYHFSIGMPVDDRRLTTKPGYDWD